MSGYIHIPVQTIRFSNLHSLREMLKKITHKFIVHLPSQKSSKLIMRLNNGITLHIELPTTTITIYDTGARETGKGIVEIHELLTHLALSIPDEKMKVEVYHSFSKENI
ncbi:MAG: hypothetical protein ACFFDT_15160 [Candidatus Hodarchaeota archaeon]